MNLKTHVKTPILDLKISDHIIHPLFEFSGNHTNNLGPLWPYDHKHKEEDKSAFLAPHNASTYQIKRERILEYTYGI